MEIYTQEMLASAANTACDMMSKYCSIDPKENSPRLLPPRHVVMKIIAVLGIGPEEAYEGLQLAGYNIDRADSVRHFCFYQEIINNPECKPQGKHDFDVVIDKLNSLLEQASKAEKGYRGEPGINKIFIRS